ncbi:MAG: mechanosensitive ion channel [Synergistales bacterium]|nr:mechanosensitive ion channel [Synergistales bacterium]
MKLHPFACALFLALLLATSGSADAFDPSSADIAALEAQAASLDSAVGEAARIDVALEAERLGLEPARITERRERLETLQLLYRRLASTLSRKETSAKELQAKEAAQAGGGRSITAEPPYPLSFLDEQQERLKGFEQRRDALDTSKTLGRRALDRARTALSEAESRRRRLVDEAQGATPPPDLAWRLGLADLAIEQAKTEIALQTALMELMDIGERSIAIDISTATRNRDWIAQNIAYSEEDLRAQIAAEEARKTELNHLLEETIRLRETLEKSLHQAQVAAEKAETEDQALAAAARIQARKAGLGYAQTALEQLQARVDYTAKAQQIWQARYAIIGKGISSEKLFSYQREASQGAQELDEALSVLQAYQTSLSSARQALKRDLAAPNLLPKVLEALREQETAVTAAIEVNLEAISDVLHLSTLNNRLIDEAKQHVGAAELAERVTTMGRQRVLEIWQTELWSSGDHAVTVGKLVVSLILMSFGFLASRRLSRYVGHKLLTRFEMEIGAAQAAERLSFYVFLFLFFLSALRTVNIPLTAFAFLGGAFAIGIGLGAQKFFADLISGFIILMQKPFRINDMIQVDGMFATVIEVGSRYTKIRTFDNADVMMPNGYLLDNRIVNWTLGDQVMRSKVTVGAGYGSDPRTVEGLLLKAAKEHLKVLPKPAPFVVFSDFGDSALVFDLYFWVNMEFASGLVTGSDLRYRIVELFREAGIEIAFPQTDVHLDVLGPVKVRIERGHDRNGEV